MGKRKCVMIYCVGLCLGARMILTARMKIVVRFVDSVGQPLRNCIGRPLGKTRVWESNYVCLSNESLSILSFNMVNLLAPTEILMCYRILFIFMPKIFSAVWMLRWPHCWRMWMNVWACTENKRFSSKNAEMMRSEQKKKEMKRKLFYKIGDIFEWE